MDRLLTSLRGNDQSLDGGSMFGNVPRALWERWLPPDDQHRVPLACRCLLVTEPGRRILFETGVGAFFEPRLRERFGVTDARHRLLDALAERGLTDADIDVVVLSHLHFDHAGGLLAAWEPGTPPRLLFPRATFVLGAEAFERARNPHARDRASFIPALPDLLEASGRLERVEGEHSETLGPDYHLHESHGHTPGMRLAEIPGRHGPVLVAADLVPGRPWVRRTITMGYDRYPELLIDEKTALLADLCDRGGRIFFTHDPDCALATLTRDEAGAVRATEERAALDGEPA